MGTHVTQTQPEVRHMANQGGGGLPRGLMPGAPPGTSAWALLTAKTLARSGTRRCHTEAGLPGRTARAGTLLPPCSCCWAEPLTPCVPDPYAQPGSCGEREQVPAPGTEGWASTLKPAWPASAWPAAWPQPSHQPSPASLPGLLQSGDKERLPPVKGLRVLFLQTAQQPRAWHIQDRVLARSRLRAHTCKLPWLREKGGMECAE